MRQPARHPLRVTPLAFTLSACTLLPTDSLAAGDLTRQEPVTVRVELGTAENALTFEPADLTFETGRLYRLVLHNPSDRKHYFSSPGLASRVFTRKVQVLHPDPGQGRLAEIKGTVSEIEVFPGGTAEWWFVPVQTVASAHLECTVGGHAEAGMTGTVTVE